MNAPRFVDTNILLYSISRDRAEARKRDIAINLLDAGDIALSVQVLQEFYVQAMRTTRADALAHEIAETNPIHDLIKVLAGSRVAKRFLQLSRRNIVCIACRHSAVS